GIEERREREGPHLERRSVRGNVRDLAAARLEHVARLHHRGTGEERAAREQEGQRQDEGGSAGHGFLPGWKGGGGDERGIVAGLARSVRLASSMLAIVSERRRITSPSCSLRSPTATL